MKSQLLQVAPEVKQQSGLIMIPFDATPKFPVPIWIQLRKGDFAKATSQSEDYKRK